MHVAQPAAEIILSAAAREALDLLILCEVIVKDDTLCPGHPATVLLSVGMKAASLVSCCTADLCGVHHIIRRTRQDDQGL